MEHARRMPNAAPSPRIEVVEALRGIAALAVAWFHFTHGAGLLEDGWLKSTGDYGWLGVEVFFVISGFVIPYSMHRGGFRLGPDVGTFLGKRVLRIEPPYIAAVLVTVALWYASAATPGFRGAAPHLTWGQVASHAGYLTAILGFNWLNPVFWSLAIEFQFYLFAALAYPAFAHASRTMRVATLGAFCACAAAIPSPIFLFGYAPLFALGIVAFWRYAGLERGPAWWFAFAAACAVAGWGLAPAMAAAGIATALAITLVRLPRVRVLAFLGAISYSLYLLHAPFGGRVVNLGARVADTLAAQLAVLACALAVSIAAAWLLWRWVDRPAQGWAARLRYRGRSSAGRAAAFELDDPDARPGTSR
jgi:peptidoglycan/LPS O-acetylase OafA/YrhL